MVFLSGWHCGWMTFVPARYREITFYIKAPLTGYDGYNNDFQTIFGQHEYILIEGNRTLGLQTGKYNPSKEPHIWYCCFLMFFVFWGVPLDAYRSFEQKLRI